MKLRQKLINKKELTLGKCTEIARNSEMAKIQAAEIANWLFEKEEALPINATKTVDLTKHKRKENQINYSSRQTCFRCGEKYKKGHNTSCNAKGRTCYKCNKKNNLA